MTSVLPRRPGSAGRAAGPSGPEAGILVGRFRAAFPSSCAGPCRGDRPVGRARAEPPRILLDGWKQAFAENPEWLTRGVHAVDRPEQAFICTGRLAQDSMLLKTDRDRNIAAARELAAQCRRSSTNAQGQIEAAPTWTASPARPSNGTPTARPSLSRVCSGGLVGDKDNIWCTVVVSQSNVKQAGEYADMFA